MFNFLITANTIVPWVSFEIMIYKIFCAVIVDELFKGHRLAWTPLKASNPILKHSKQPKTVKQPSRLTVD